MAAAVADLPFPEAAAAEVVVEVAWLLQVDVALCYAAKLNCVDPFLVGEAVGKRWVGR